jgi:tRNA dimethylallyltransferase
LIDFSQNFQIGIFQSIGFKEFDAYLNKRSDENEKVKKQLFDQGVDAIKTNTKRYAKKQIKWVFNRFIKSKRLLVDMAHSKTLQILLSQGSNESTPNVYELDTTDLENWDSMVSEKAFEILRCFLEVSLMFLYWSSVYCETTNAVGIYT